jgi:hypothetical protein
MMNFFTEVGKIKGSYDGSDVWTLVYHMRPSHHMPR